MEYFDNSTKALAMKAGNPTIGREKYPWKDVPPGKSFAVDKNGIKINVLRSLASKTGKKLGKRFRVVDHEGPSYEVACLRMTEQEAIQSSQNIVEVLGKIKEGNGE